MDNNWSPRLTGVRLLLIALFLAIWIPGCDGNELDDLDGQIAYVERVDTDFHVFVMNADGSGRTQLTTSGSNYYPRWSPDGKHIIYGANKAGDWNIYSIRPDGTDERVFVSLASDDDLQAISTPTWSPDGSSLIHTGRQFIYQVAGDGSVVERLSDEPCHCSFPDWSPDGQSIAYVFYHGEESADFDIYVAAADGTDPVNLTRSPATREATPAWSPDGTEIAFARGDAIGLSNIFVMDSDGSNVRQLTHYKSGDIAGDPTWSPDGSKIVYHRLQHGIYVMNPDGKGQRLLGGAASAVWPDWK